MGRLWGTVGGYSFGMPSGFVRVDLEKIEQKIGDFFCPIFFISERFAVLLLAEFKTMLGK